MFNTLISAEQLNPILGQRDLVIVDCRFSLDDTEAGRRGYLEAHIPGAVYAHLDHDLSGPIIPGKTGRHPLPDVSILTETLSRWGIDDTVQVVAYDAAGGDMAAARLWWMLKWLGHEKAAVLDGGFSEWLRRRQDVRSGQESNARRRFTPQVQTRRVVSVKDVEAASVDSTYCLLDARSAATFRGEGPSYDPIPGRIPGAQSAPRTENLGPAGLFKSPVELKERYARLLEGRPIERTIMYCGSGVTAAHNALALEYCGLGAAPLFPGSFSEWITDPSRAVVRG